MPTPTPAQRSRRRATRFDSLLLTVLAIAGCCCAGWLGVVAARPFVRAYQMRSENAQIERKMLETRLEIQNLRKAVAILGTARGMEMEARRMGYVRQGEVPLIIP